MEQFHFFWNCSTKSGIVPLCVDIFLDTAQISIKRLEERLVSTSYIYTITT
jgi:hypothetical protein